METKEKSITGVFTGHCLMRKPEVYYPQEKNPVRSCLNQIQDVLYCTCVVINCEREIIFSPFEPRVDYYCSEDLVQ